MTTLIPAAQLFTVRMFNQDTAGFRETLRRVAEIGYTAVQISAIGPIPAPDIKAALEQVKQENSYLFETAETPPPYAFGTGTGGSGGTTSGLDASIRAAAGLAQ